MSDPRSDSTADAGAAAPPRTARGGRLRAALGRMRALRAGSRTVRPAPDDPDAPIRTLVDPRDIYLA